MNRLSNGDMIVVKCNKWEQIKEHIDAVIQSAVPKDL